MPARERPNTSAIIAQAIKDASQSSDAEGGENSDQIAIEEQKASLQSKIEESKQQTSFYQSAFKKDTALAKKIQANASKKKKEGLEKQARGSETSAYGQGTIAAGTAVSAAGGYSVQQGQAMVASAAGPQAAQAVVGGALIKFGYVLIGLGLAGVATGVGLVIKGAETTAEGNVETALAMEGVEDAINKGNLAEVKAQQATAKLGETSMYMAMLAQLEALEEQSPETEDMSEDELAAWREEQMARIGEGFAIAAQSIMDNGIFTLQGQNGEDLYFAQDGNNFYSVEPKKDSSGNIARGPDGELTGDWDPDTAVKVDRDSEDYALLSMYSDFVDVVNEKVSGMDGPPLTRVVRSGDGTYTTVPVDLANAEDRAWIAAVTRSAANNGDNGLRYIQDQETGQWGYRMQDMHTEEWLSPFVAANNLNDTTFDQLGISGFSAPGFGIRSLGAGEASFDPSAYGLVGASAHELASSFIGGSLQNDSAAGDDSGDPSRDDPEDDSPLGVA